MERIPEQIDSKFRFVLLASLRAEQMMHGAKPKLEMGNVKVTRMAMEEIIADKVGWEYGPEPEPEPLLDEEGDGAEMAYADDYNEG